MAVIALRSTATLSEKASVAIHVFQGLASRLAGAMRRTCPACSSRTDSHPLCDPCRLASALDGRWRQREIGDREKPLTVYALGLYRDLDGRSPSPAAHVLRRFKYAKDRSAGRALVRAIARSSSLPLTGDAVFVPIPLHPRRLRQRGFNQAAWFARALARRSRRPLLPDVLRCTLDAPSRAQLSRADRETASVDLFRVARPLPAGLRTFLVDDVCTTGTTLCAARSILEAAGVSVQAAAVLLSTEWAEDALSNHLSGRDS